jgi:uncharacterized protein YlxW (UPF0749 family)
MPDSSSSRRSADGPADDAPRDPGTGAPERIDRAPWASRFTRAFHRRMATYRERSLAWRLLVPLVFVLAGALFVTSSISAGGTDLRAGRYGDLGTVVEQQKDEVDALRAERNDLAAEVEELSSGVRDTAVEEAQRQVDELRPEAGLQAVAGPGLTVTLDDAPDAVVDSADIAVDKLVVHQQDIQAVVNAMWAGGAEAMTIQGQRVVSTTGVKCVGNTVVLHGVPYSPPYVITAVGDPDAMLTSLSTNPYIEIYKQYVDAYQLGWEVEPETSAQLPAYEGPLELDYARPAGNSEDRTDGDI